MDDITLAARIERRVLLASLRLPASLRRRVAGPPPVNDRGSEIPPDLAWAVWIAARSAKEDLPPDAARADMQYNITLVEPRPAATVARCVDLELAGRPARLYAPAGERLPVLLYLHGGGWVVGDLRSHDRLCRRLAAEAGWLVVALDYRLAPEHPFPAGLEDACAAWSELSSRVEELGGDPARVAIGGDSAGGNLSAACCLVLRDRGESLPTLQVLIYPALDLRLQSASIEAFATGFVLTRRSMERYRAHYAPPDWLDPRASPLLAPDLAGLPPALVVTAGFDPLRDEGEAYVARLAEAGVAVEHYDAAGMVHGFVNMDGALPSCDAALAELIRRLRSRGQVVSC